MKIKIDWLDEINAALKNTNGTDNSLNIEDIFHIGFMLKHTQFSSIQEMFRESWFEIVEQDDLQKTADPNFDYFIVKSTHFTCWNEMVSCAGKEFMKSKITDI